MTETSINPWVDGSTALSQSNATMTNEEILDRIRYFLRKSTKQLTALLNYEEKYHKLADILTGYIEVFPTVSPFDLPLLHDSRLSFELVLNIDLRKSLFNNGSLWIDLMEYIDSNPHRGHVSASIQAEDEADKCEKLIALLFLGLGENPPSKKDQKPVFSRAAQSVLAEIFTYEEMDSWFNVSHYMANPVEKSTFRQDWGYYLKIVEFKRIKNWLNDINPILGSNYRESQNYLRGSSTLLSIILSQQTKLERGTDRIPRTRFGANIIVDGGGRLVSRFRTEDFAEVLEQRDYGHQAESDWGDSNPIESIFNLDRNDYATKAPYPTNHKGDIPFPGSEQTSYQIGTRKFSYFNELVQHICPLFGRDKSNISDFSNQLGFDYSSFSSFKKYILNRKIPGLEFRLMSDSDILAWRTAISKDELDWKEFGEYLVEKKNIALKAIGEGDLKALADGDIPARARVHPPWEDTCPRCNPKLPLPLNEAELVLDKDGGFCIAHRVIYFLGKQQRLRDSALNQQSYGDRQVSIHSKNRKITAISRIDGNSIGWIFNRSRFNNQVDGNANNLRRRSMRFNAHWWISLYDSMNKQNSIHPDGIACWVSAGDDIILAAYDDPGISEKNAAERLVDLLEDFAINIREGINTEMIFNKTGPVVSFCASVVHDEDGVLNNIFHKSTTLESVAKKLWKDEYSRFEKRALLSPLKIEKTQFDIHEMYFDSIVWTDDILVEIAKLHDLDLTKEGDLAKLSEICSRAEIVEVDSTQKILIRGRDIVDMSKQTGDFKQYRINSIEDIDNFVLIKNFTKL